ncbi:hypothetical protein NHX12_019909 [Muraenolepis orangiensis]|uniref:Uncharacterized protein n=1 Tax=Muraenolepis orangiensis TaxID=630683 RepID=A0A9Q0IXM1_9TELE|nr:hypothetical protein NHX12_019909 [Muraenolepis orangiensis]
MLRRRNCGGTPQNPVILLVSKRPNTSKIRDDMTERRSGGGGRKRSRRGDEREGTAQTMALASTCGSTFSTPPCCLGLRVPGLEEEGDSTGAVVCLL